MWMPPIVQTVASEGKGIDDLIDAIASHHQYLLGDDGMTRLERQRLELEVYQRLRDALMTRLLETVPDETLSGMIDRVQAREIAPHDAVHALLAQVEK
jgi:LAO/AO transport system kinase